MVRPKAIFFDINETLLDLGPVKDEVERALGGRRDLVALWFSTLLHHSLVLSAAGRFAPFGAVGAAALQMVASGQGIDLTDAAAAAAVSTMRRLPAHPDVAPGLERLWARGYRLLALTNSSNDAARAQLAHAGLLPLFEAALSVEAVRKYKPHPEVYRHACVVANVSTGEAMMVAAHGWDVAGAQWAGMRAAFVARPGQPLFPLSDAPEIVVPTFEELAQRLLSQE